MPKRVFWPVAAIVMGLIFLASNLRMLPSQFWNLWPLILIVVGLGGLVTSDRDEWMGNDNASKKAAPASKVTTKKSAKPSKVAARTKAKRK